MDILKSFETFLSEPLSVLRKGLVQIVGITTGTGRTEVSANMLKQKTQITIANNEKIYNLLKRVNAKHAEKFSSEEEPVFGQLTLRV